MVATSWNTNYAYANGRRTYDIRGKWINARNSSLVWQPLMLDFADRVQANGLFSFEAPLLATGRATFSSDINWHVGLKSNITAPAYEIGIEAVGVSPVEGAIEGSTATYAGAYGDDGDLIYQVRHGRAPRLEKLVRWHQEPSGTGDVRVSFDLLLPTTEITTLDGSLPEDAATVADKLSAWRDAVARNVSIPEITQAEIDYRWWLLQYGWQGSKQTSVSLMGGQQGDNRGATIQPAYVWDSAGNRQRITLELEQAASGIRLTKVVPRSFLATASYPVWTDATTTVYPDANPETTTCDGRVFRASVTEDWSVLAAGAGNGFSDTDASINGIDLFASATSNKWQQNVRSIFLFDTSAIDDTENIDSATFTVARGTVTGVLSGTAVTVVGSTPASNTGLAASDYGQVGSTPYATAAALGSGANVFTLNSTGLAAVSKTGVTKLGLREKNYDIDGVAPTWSSTVRYAAALTFAEQTGSTNDPKLIVSSTTPPGKPTHSMHYARLRG